MATERKYILVEKRGAVAKITINRPGEKKRFEPGYDS